MNNTSIMSDSDLVEVVRSGNKELFAEIIKRYQNKLLRYATFILDDPDAGADIVQESFIKSYINLNSFNTNKKFSSWIYRIVHNQAMNYLNKNKKQRPINPDIEYDSGVDLEEKYIKNEIISHAHDCLGEMSVIYKVPLSLYYLEEKTYEEISDILRIPIATVGTRISRAKVIMKNICQRKSK